MMSTNPDVNSEYSWKTTADEVATQFSSSCKGRNVIVTGANCGLGFETARVLAEKGCEVILCSRDKKNGDDAVAQIKKTCPDCKVLAMQLDLSSLSSVDSFAKAVKQRKEPVHILINNAGVMACNHSLTEDGYESQFGVNHLGHFHLTRLLLPTLQKSGTAELPSRVINLSSMGNWLFAPPEGIKFDDINGNKSYDPWERYGQSKLANILFTRELQRRMHEAKQPVIAVSVHPGAIIGTNLKRNFSFRSLLVFVSNLYSKGGFSVAYKEPYKSIAQGSATTVFAALSPNIIPGEHYANCKADTLVHPKGSDRNLAALLWTKSEEYINMAVKK